MDMEAQTLSRVLADEDCDNLESIKTKKESQETSETGSSVTNEMEQMSIESGDQTQDSQQNISDSRSGKNERIVITYMSHYKKGNCSQKKQNKFMQMDREAQAISRVLADEDCDSLENIKEKKESQETSETGSSVTNEMEQMSIENSDQTQDSQQNISDNSSEKNERNVIALMSIVDMYQTCDSEESREEVRKIAIQIAIQITTEFVGFGVSIAEPGEFVKKYALSAPYHLFYTRVLNSKETYNQQFSITFPEILDRSLGEIVNSLHLNFMVDVEWLCLQYLLAGQRTNMMILYGKRVDDEKLSSNITIIKVDMPNDFGCHHTKIMILQYKDNGIRVVVFTGNYYLIEWYNRTQGLWISPHLPLLPESANPNDGESPTGFKKDLVRYLSKYEYPALTQWIRAVQRADFSDVNVFLVASVPGSHTYNKTDLWGFKKLAHVLSRHATLPPDASQWPIVAQSSSVGNFGPKFNSWLLKDIIRCMSQETTKGLKSHPNFQFIYPSIQNYKQSFNYRKLCSPLGYSAEVHSKQQWILSYLYQWKAKRTGRDRSMPHIKSYTRISPDLKRIPWFVLTSANLSKSAWGVQRDSHVINNYEAGVVFIPKFITGTTTFPIEDEEDPAVPVFPILYDLPLCRYESSDSPFVNEFLNPQESTSSCE